MCGCKNMPVKVAGFRKSKNRSIGNIGMKISDKTKNLAFGVVTGGLVGMGSNAFTNAVMNKLETQDKKDEYGYIIAGVKTVLGIAGLLYFKEKDAFYTGTAVGLMADGVGEALQRFAPSTFKPIASIGIGSSRYTYGDGSRGSFFNDLPQVGSIESLTSLRPENENVHVFNNSRMQIRRNPYRSVA